mmetsp:Transcript_31409/g.56917  ORF Transcript_31409/g.56917 Transcript_31409/m.56917 type:complete len:259 (-) Transcript_31409:71-847(-)
MPKRSTTIRLSQWLQRATALVLILSCSQAWIPLGAPSPPPLVISSLTTADALSFSNPATLWGLRMTSAVVSYISLVAFLDRPRGTLLLNENQYEIKPSQVENAGLGFYVTESLPQGTILGTYPGVLLPLDQNLRKLQQYPQCEAYIWRFSDSKFICDPTDARGKIQSLCTGGNPSVPFSVEICSLLAKPVSTALTRINEPPTGRDVNVVTQENLDERTTTFVLERNVYAGEELFMDYGLTYDRSGYGGSIISNDENKL